ncbi:MAG: single-stranded-DNA-specific exonuclease RecJ [Pseudomonadota bacterium]
MTQYKWVYKQNDKSLIKNLASKLNINHIFSTILINRGIFKPSDFEEYILAKLSYMLDPALFQGLEKASERISKAIIKKEKIAIYGDYDVDGVTSIVLLYEFFIKLDTRVIYYVPSRFNEGYGFKEAGLRKLKKENVDVIITVDCGITSIKEAKLAKELGIDLIITDHHEVTETLPEAYAIIDPKQKDCEFPYKDIAGVGVAFYLATGVRASLRDKGYFNNKIEPNMKEYLDLVALGTVADIAPITNLNRIFVKNGLLMLTNSQRPGVNALKEVSGLSAKKIDYYSIAFMLAPRLNASGRISSAEDSINILLSADYEASLEKAKILDAHNRKRQAIEKEIFNEISNYIDKSAYLKDRKSIVLGNGGWHEGVLGIVASKLVEKYYVPTILMSFDGDKGKGSGRSIKNFHILEAISLNSNFLQGFGGHKYAAGISLLKKSYEDFSLSFDRTVKDLTTADDFIQRLEIDVDVDATEIDYQLVINIEKMEPFGPSNLEPILSSQVQVENIREVGDNHLKIVVTKNKKRFNGIAFNMFRKHSDLEKGDFIKIAFSPRIDTYGGFESISLKIKDIKKN